LRLSAGFWSRFAAPEPKEPAAISRVVVAGETEREAFMSDYRNPDPRDPVTGTDLRVRHMRDSNAMWGWIAGAVVVAVVLIVMFSFGRDDTRMAANPPPGTPPISRPANQPMNPPAATPAPAPSPANPNPGAAR
jgi:hypothetical protein